MSLLPTEALAATYYVVTGPQYQTTKRRGYSIRRRDGADPKDYATVYAERKNETCEWQWSCFRSWGRLTAAASIDMARDWQDAADTAAYEQGERDTA